ncbi:MAG: LON peptidase substrate-binding domain-containing protein, partial [Spirochaetia bacterium]|nr:LON peptidase substrate-binding domain-containing protein [Spirochaetia bacterium]
MAEKEIVTLENMLPDRLFIVPLSGKPIFPGIFTPLMIVSHQDIATVEKALTKSGGILGLTMLKDDNGEDDSPVSIEDLYSVGTVAKIVKKINLPDGGMNIFISTLKRFRIITPLTRHTPIAAEVEYLDEVFDKSSNIKALTQAILSEMKQISENNPLFSEEMRLNMVNIDQPGKIADFVASILNVDRKEQQDILETLDIRERMEKVIIFIKKEQELLRIQKKIQRKINEKIEKSQREYFLKEEMKAIRKELGLPVDSKDSEYTRFKEAIDGFHLTGEVKEEVEQELEKFSMMDSNS